MTSTATAPLPWAHLDQMRTTIGFAGLPAYAPRHIGGTADGARLYLGVDAGKAIFGPHGSGKTIALHADIAGAALDPHAQIAVLGNMTGELDVWDPLAEMRAKDARGTVRALETVATLVEHLHQRQNRAARERSWKGLPPLSEPERSATWVFIDNLRQIESELDPIGLRVLRSSVRDIVEHGPRVGFRVVAVMDGQRIPAWANDLFGQWQELLGRPGTPGKFSLRDTRMSVHRLTGAHLSAAEQHEVVQTALRLRAAQAASTSVAV